MTKFKDLVTPRSPQEVPEGMLPLPVFEHISFAQLEKPISTPQIMSTAPKGAHFEEISLPIKLFTMGQESYGRLRDNSDLLQGYKDVIYHDMSHYREIRNILQSRLPPLMKEYQTKFPKLFAMEESAFGKIAAQRGNRPGGYMQLPLEAISAGDLFPDDLKRAIEVVVKRFASATTLGGKTETLMREDTNPTSTSCGMPTMASGAQGATGRILTAGAYPTLDLSRPPDKYLKDIIMFGQSIGLPGNTIIAAVTGKRRGQMIKPQPAYGKGGNGFSANYDVVGLYDRYRLVYGYPTLLNVLMAPFNVQLKKSRIAIPGMFHTPELDAAVYPSISRRKYHYANDFSGLDQHMNPKHKLYVYDLMIKLGYDQWSTQLAKLLEDAVDIIYPSWEASDTTYTLYSGPKGMLSGEKGTSSLDTIIAVAVTLTAIERQQKGSISKWLSNDFIIMAQGDDGLFGLDVALDAERFNADCLEMGYVTKLVEEETFLMQILPLSGGRKHAFRLIARIFQQTFYNEDNYLSNRSPADARVIAWLGLTARMDSIQFHPAYPIFKDLFVSMVMSLPFVSVLNSAEVADFKRTGIAVMSQRMTAEVIKVTSKDSDILSRLLARADSDPSAMKLVNHLQSIGMDVTDSQTFLTGFQNELVNQLKTDRKSVV